MTHQWVSVEEAARRLNISVSTVRRRIEAGTLEAEREVIGGSKERYRVRVETQQEAPDEASAVQVTPNTADASDKRHDAPAITERALEIFSATFKGNLEMIREKDARILADADRIAGLMRQLGKAEATADTLRERITDLAQALAERQVELEELRDRASRPWWKRVLGYN